ncbi:MAG: hypothetical protein AAGA57_08470 [Planctomycetota bacterium]
MFRARPIAFVLAVLFVTPAWSGARSGDWAGAEGWEAERDRYYALLEQNAGLLAKARAGEALSAEQEAALGALRPTLDALAHQKDAWASGLYWHTDLEVARAEAARTGRAVLSLRLLGSLDDDLSCANSRFFRAVLYPDLAVWGRMRDGFVLHWQGVADVPRVTVEYADGRKLERTVVGNSMHLVLDARGRVLGAMPGLVSPAAFVDWLEAMAGHHHDALAAGAGSGGTFLAWPGDSELSSAGDAVRPAWLRPVPVEADRLTASKRFIAEPMRAALGVLPPDAPETPEAPEAPDAVEAAAPWEAVDGVPLALTVSKMRIEAPMRGAIEGGAVRLSADAPLMREGFGLGQQTRLSTSSKAVLSRLEFDGQDPPAGWFGGVEETIDGDTRVNLERLAPEIARGVREGRFDVADAEAFTAAVYRDVFLMPLDDPWLGLSPGGAMTGLDGRGERVSR